MAQDPSEPTVVMESLTSTLGRDSREATLVAMRARLAWQIDSTYSSRDLIGLTSQLRGVLADLDEVRGVVRKTAEVNEEAENVIDQIRRKREERAAAGGA